MAKEIERKFLVTGAGYRALAFAKKEIVQGYLNDSADCTVRVRISGENAYITIKSRNHGAERNEWEYPVPVADASEMLESCRCTGVIEKTRYLVDAGDGLTWEVDEFHGRLQGLVLAEIELPSADCPFSVPDFIGEEVTGNAAYYNSVLAKG